MDGSAKNICTSKTLSFLHHIVKAVTWKTHSNGDITRYLMNHIVGAMGSSTRSNNRLSGRTLEMKKDPEQIQLFLSRMIRLYV